MLYVDIETFSSVDLKLCGPYAYTESPDFEILMCGWTDDGENYHLALGEEEIREIPGLFDPSVEKVAHRAHQFERICFQVLHGGPMDPEQFIDTQMLAAEYGYPQALANLAKALGADPKDTAGTRLINTFCKPQRGGKRLYPEDRPQRWEEFKNYCVQDVRTLVDVHRRLPEWPTETEHRVLIADQKINDRGIKVDLEMARAAVDAAEANDSAFQDELYRLTELENPNSVQQLLKWLQESGLRIENLQAATVQNALGKTTLTASQRRVLELRQEIALVTSKKYLAAIRGCSGDGRFRGGFKFFGAHTGRWAGQRLQLHNLTRDAFTKIDPDTGKKVHDLETETLAIAELKSGMGASAADLKKLMRSLFTGPFTVVDYVAIEACVLAWLAGEQWKLKAFAEGHDVYVATATRMGGLTRSQGKIAELALGYNGGPGSLRAMAGDEDSVTVKGKRRNSGGTVKSAQDEESETTILIKHMSDEQLYQMFVYPWRDANRAIVQFWKRLDAAFRNGGKVGHLRVEVDGSDRRIVLPSGRALTYHNVKTGERITFDSPLGYRTDTYGGRLTENVTQAVARDILAEALVRLEQAGYAVVGHVHDEILVEGEDVDGVVKVMTEAPDWAAGLPIDAEGFLCDRYRKG